MRKTLSMDAVSEIENCAGEIQTLIEIVYLNFKAFFS